MNVSHRRANPTMRQILPANKLPLMLIPPLAVLMSFAVAGPPQVSSAVGSPDVGDAAQRLVIENASSGLRWLKDEAGVSLVDDGVVRLRHEFRSGGKPIVFPLLSPAGRPLTRSFPMTPLAEGGSKDHVHQRSLWMTHGEVNDVDFWVENERAGTVQHREVVSLNATDRTGSLVTTADWVAPAVGGGQPTVLLNERRVTTVDFSSSPHAVDFVIDLTAVADRVNFGDTKEGSFGIRMADSIAVDSKQGGLITNANGQSNVEAWGKRANWVDYSGPVDGDTVGISVLEHPSSFGHPCRWHVRTYGLFAANPFGEHHFVGGDRTEGHTLSKGETIRLAYRLLLHDGPADQEMVNAAWRQFSETTLP